MLFISLYISIFFFMYLIYKRKEIKRNKVYIGVSWNLMSKVHIIHFINMPAAGGWLRQECPVARAVCFLCFTFRINNHGCCNGVFGSNVHSRKCPPTRRGGGSLRVMLTYDYARLPEGRAGLSGIFSWEILHHLTPAAGLRLAKQQSSPAVKRVNVTATENSSNAPLQGPGRVYTPCFSCLIFRKINHGSCNGDFESDANSRKCPPARREGGSFGNLLLVNATPPHPGRRSATCEATKQSGG